MHTATIITFPVRLPDWPWDLPMISSLQQGANGRIGITIQSTSDLPTANSLCTFFEIDLMAGSVKQSVSLIHSKVLFQMRPWYDKAKQQWIVVLRGKGTGGSFLNVYSVPPHGGEDASWPLLFAANSLDDEYQSDKYLITLWHHGQEHPLLFTEVDETFMYDAMLCWTQWDPSRGEQPWYHHLGSAYSWVPFINEEGCLLFTCQCFYEQIVPDPVYRKNGPGQWVLMAAAYTHDGKMVRQTALPSATTPIRDLRQANHDLSESLTISMAAASGPQYGRAAKKSCVAAMVLNNQPGLGDRRRAKDRGEPVGPTTGWSATGGIYCLDMQGTILDAHEGIHGEKISLGTCGALVVGTRKTIEEQWQVWNWRPFHGTDHVITASLSPQVRRATVVVREEDTASRLTEEEDWFWCVEEEDQGFRVTKRVGQDLSLKEAVWCQGLILPSWFETPCLGPKPLGLQPFQDGLLVIAMNNDHHIQLLRFE